MAALIPNGGEEGSDMYLHGSYRERIYVNVSVSSINRAALLGVLLVLAALPLVAQERIAAPSGPSSAARTLLDSASAAVGPRNARQARGMRDTQRVLTVGGALRTLVVGETGGLEPRNERIVASPLVNAKNFLKSWDSAFGIEGDATQFVEMKTIQRKKGVSVRLRQTYGGVPVFAGEAIVQQAEGGKINAVFASLMLSAKAPKLSGSAPRPAVSESDARAVAIQSVLTKHKNATLRAAPGELVYYAPEVFLRAGETRLAWQFLVTGAKRDLVAQRVLVDAETNVVLLRINEVMAAKERFIYDAENNGVDGILARGEGDSRSPIDDVNLAYDYLGMTHDFFSVFHDRDGLDGIGGPLNAIVRVCHDEYGCPMPQAYWYQDTMYFGEGWTTALDVIGHELAHGFTQSTSGLEYVFEPGAINESLSDLWGEWIDLHNSNGPSDAQTDWLLGEDLEIGTIRSLKNPEAFEQPDRYSRLQDLPLEYDNGGVHINSGIGNKLGYLLTDGGTFNGYTILGEGIEVVSDIFYNAQTTRLHASSNYQDLALALIDAAAEIGYDAENVRNACLAVEILPAVSDEGLPEEEDEVPEDNGDEDNEDPEDSPPGPQQTPDAPDTEDSGDLPPRDWRLEIQP